MKVRNKAIKYRLYPTEEQATLFLKTFGCCRKVYNHKIESYKLTGKFITVTPAIYKNDYPYLKEVDSLALANAELNLQAAFKRYFDKKNKRKNRFPKFKSAKHTRRAYTTNNQNGTVAIIDNSIKLPKIGRVKAVIHREPNKEWKIKSATISKDGDGKYYASVLFETEENVVRRVGTFDNAIGLDYASSGLYIDEKGMFHDHNVAINIKREGLRLLKSSILVS